MDEAKVFEQQKLALERTSAVIAFYNLSDEEWDALPTSVQDKLKLVYDSI